MNKLPFSIDNIDYETVRNAILNGYIPSKEDIIDNDELLNYDWFISLAFAYDPNVITLFKEEDLTNELCLDALSRGYKPNKEDILSNNFLYKFEPIINYIINNDPPLILLIKSDERYIKQLKKEILSKYIYNGRVDELYIDDKKKELLNLLNLSLDEDNINDQEKYSYLLEKIINKLCKKYNNIKKENIALNSVDKIDSFIKEYFRRYHSCDDLSRKIYRYVNGTGDTIKKEYISMDYIKKELTRLYDLFLNNKLTFNESSGFYNELLNDIENKIENEYKKFLMKQVKSRLILSNKKTDSIIRGIKIKKVEEIIRDGLYQNINTSKEEMLNDLFNLRDYIRSIKDIRRSQVTITDDDFEFFENIFIKDGTIDIESINTRINNYEISKIIQNKYTKFKMKYIDNIDIYGNDLQILNQNKEKIDYNYNNYKIIDKNRICDNIADVIISITDDRIEKIEENELLVIRKVATLLYFANLMDDFTTNDFINILVYYDKIANQINCNYDDTINYVYDNIDTLITLSKKYSLVNDYAKYILSQKTIDEIGDTNVNDYLNIYLKAYTRNSSTIPKVKGRVCEYTYESGNFQDEDKLLIGYVQPESCIKLDNLAGRETFKNTMLDKNTDVILIKDKNNDLVARTIMFRRGNAVILAPTVTKYYNKSEILNDKFLSDISSQIIKKAKQKNDNIDFVFVSGESTGLFKNYPCYKDQRPIRICPHSDISDNLYLINTSDRIKRLNEDYLLKYVNYFEPIRTYYDEKENDIRTNRTEEELNKIKALRVELEDDPILRKELKKEFEPIKLEDYKYIVSNNNWYIAVRNDGTIDEVMLPTCNLKDEFEFNRVKNQIKSKYKL